MSETKSHDPILVQLYERFLSTYDTVNFVHTMSERYTAATLQRLATHADCKYRRAAVFALGFIGRFDANCTVGQALQDVDRIVRLLADSACRRVWNRVEDTQHRKQLISVIRLNAAGRFPDAVAAASALLDAAPEYSEVWYQRGSAWFQLGDHTQAIRDWQRTLAVNQYHFVAAAALGDAYLRLDDNGSALEAFWHALALNPELEKVRSQADQLARQLDEGEAGF